MPTPFKLAPLPWDEDALAPTISANPIAFHHHKHHQTYVSTLNKLVEDSRFADMKLEKIVQKTAGAEGPKDKKIFSNAAQVWNRDFYWRSLPPAKTETGAMLAEAGKEQFGSGWVWLVSQGGKLSVEKTSNAETPMAKGVNCLLTVDVWEHAYYLDYQNARQKYLESLLGKILDWDFAAENLTKEDHAVREAVE